MNKWQDEKKEMKIIWCQRKEYLVLVHFSQCLLLSLHVNIDFLIFFFFLFSLPWKGNWERLMMMMIQNIQQ